MSKAQRVISIFARAASILLVCSLALTAQNKRQRPPNILVIVADDMGYADIGVHGATDIPTPHIDALAKSGIRFTDGYVSGPYCSPTRAGLLTGLYPQRFGHEFNPAGRRFGLARDQVTMADHLKAAGYRTALIGKWHLGSSEEHHPMSRGFDEFFGFLGGAHSYLDPMTEGSNPLLDGRKRVTHVDYTTDAFAGRAAEFIAQQGDKPFFLYLAFNAVHGPLQATDKYLARFAHISDRKRRTYAAMLSAMDDGVGRTIAALRQQKLEENTLIFFFSDNGGPMRRGVSATGASNGSLRGAKLSTYEGGIRVPFIISWKGHLPAGVVDSRPIIQLDVLPTSLAAAGVDLSKMKLDGVNLLPYLVGGKTEPHDALYWRMGRVLAIRRGNWKLVKSPGGPPAMPSSPADLTGAQLYDLAADIGEKTNLASKYPAKVKELAAAWQEWERGLAMPAWVPSRGN